MGRTVALKFLKAPHADRFRREAKDIAALNHPLFWDVDGAAAWYHRAIDQREIWVLVHARGWLAQELRASAHGPVILKKAESGLQ